MKMVSDKIWDKYLPGLIIAVLSVYVVLPLLNMVLASVKPLSEIQVSSGGFFPSRFDFGTYIRMWQTVPLSRYIVNSTIIVTTATALSIVMSILAGYALDRFRFRGRKVFGHFLVSAQTMPNFLILLPLYLIYVFIRTTFRIPMVGTYQGIIVTYLAFTLPFSIWMMKGFFETIPRELEEAAFIDGCGYVTTIRKIILPLSLPGVVAVAIYAFLLGWQEVLFSSVLTDQRTRTVAIGLRNYASATTIYWNEMMAAAVTVTIPIVILFVFLQRYFISGLTAGGVKG